MIVATLDELQLSKAVLILSVSWTIGKSLRYPFRPSEHDAHLNGCILLTDVFLHPSFHPPSLRDPGSAHGHGARRAEAAEERTAALEALVTELTTRLNQNSTSSHKPPSSRSSRPADSRADQP